MNELVAVDALSARPLSGGEEIQVFDRRSVDNVELGARQVNGAGASKEEIVAQVRHVSQLIGDIASATSEQATGIGQVGDAVNQLDQVTQQNAALVEQSAAAESLRQQAASLAEVASVFKLVDVGAPGRDLVNAGTEKNLRRCENHCPSHRECRTPDAQAEAAVRNIGNRSKLVQHADPCEHG